MPTAIILLLLAAAPSDPAATNQHPNVVMIVGDDMAWTDYGFASHPHVKTPNIDRLAADGALFPNAYVPTSLCRASLATLLTGMYAHQHKICCNDPPKGVDRSLMLPFLRDAPTIPRLLQQREYRSFQTGKFWEGPFENGGFTHGMTKTGRHGEEGLAIGRQTMQPIYDFITQSKSQPFFVWYAPMMPHQPHNPPERILKKYSMDGRDVRQAKYWGMCEWFDETCGDLLKWLDDHKLTDNTLVVYVVDNGWVQSTGPTQPGEQFLTRSKNTPYDGGVRTPVILRWPGRIKPGRHDDLVSTIDLAPTILSACGIKAPEKMPGVNLIDVASGAKPLRRDAVFGEIYTHDCVELGKPVLSVTHRWVRQGDWKLIVPTKDKSPSELFNLATDPHEKQSLAEANADRVVQLTKFLDGWWKLEGGVADHSQKTK